MVGIIALLMSILLPALDRGRAQARKILCLSNQQAQIKASFFYAEANDGWVGRGILGFGGDEYGIYATSVLKYLGYNGDTRALWDGSSGSRPSKHEQRRLRRVLRQYGEQLQCPDFPDTAHDQTGELTVEPSGRAIDTSLLDYVASAMPVPYTQEMIDFDEEGGGEAGDRYQAERGTPDYVPLSKLDDISLNANPAQVVYVTEAHASLPWDDFSFHHFFLTSQLPFGKYPRIASDQRHPGGIDTLFFDGHATVVSNQSVDPGWPNGVGMRLRLFSPLP